MPALGNINKDKFPIRYEVEITGDVPPYEWRLVILQGSNKTSVEGGRVDSIVEAQFEAAAKAHEIEDERRWKFTQQRIVLFEIEA